MRVWRLLGSTVGTGTMIAGTSTVPEDMANWGAVFTALGPSFFQWALVLVGLLIVVAANWDYLHGRVLRAWRPMWRLHLERRDRYPLRRIVPMSEGVRLVFEGAEGSLLMKMYRQQTQDDPQRIKAWFAGYISHREEVTIFGREPPSSRLVEIPRDEFKMCAFADDCMSLRRLQETTPRYVDLHMLKADAALIARTIGPRTETILKG